MTGPAEERLAWGAAALVEASRRRPRATLALCVLATVASLGVVVTSLEVDTDSDRLLSPDLPVRQTNLALAEAFPELQNNLVVMVEADTAEDARAAAEALRARLAREPERYPGVFLPGHGPYWEEFGLFLLDGGKLDALADRVERAGPLLATLVERPELPVLLGALSHLIGGAEGLDALGPDGEAVLDRLALAIEGFVAGERRPIAWDGLLFEDLGAGTPNPQLLFVRPAGDLTQLDPVLEAVSAIRALAGELEPHPGLRVRVTGDRAVHSEEMSLVVVEAGVAAAASLVLVTLILFYCLRSIRLVAATVVTLLVGLVWTAGVAGLAVGELNALTSAFAVVYIGLAVDFGIHFGMGYLERRRMGDAAPAALRVAGRGVGGSLVLCGITTAIGFYAFLPTDYTGVADMGIISGTGVLLGLLATLTLYPALVSLGLGARAGTAPRRFELRLPTFPARHPRTVCAVAGLVSVACVASLAWLRFDVNTLNVRDPRVESVQALRDLLEDRERSAWTVEVLVRDLTEARGVAARLETLDGVRRVNTLERFLGTDRESRLATFREMRRSLETPVGLRDEETGAGLDRRSALEVTIADYGVALDIDAELRGGLGGDDPVLAGAARLRAALDALERTPAPDLDALEADLFGALPDLLAGIEEALPTRAPILEDLPVELRRRYLAEDGRARVEVFSSFDLTEPGALERFSDLVHTVRPDAGGPAAGTVALGRAIVGSLQQALVTAVLAIAILLLVLLRSVTMALVTLTPLVVGALATAAASTLLGISFNFANVIVLPLILGIGVDSGIHLVHRHRRGLPPGVGLLRTATAGAVLFSAVTTAGSFATLATSHHLGISSLAQMLTLGIALMLAANALLLPAILSWLDPLET